MIRPPEVGVLNIMRPGHRKRHFHARAIIAIACFAIVAVLAIVMTRAATSVIDREAESGSLTKATPIQDAGASGGQAIKFTSTNGSTNCTTDIWQNLEACGWPGPANTGYAPGTTLTNTSGRTVSAPNTVIQNERITGRLYINAANVTVRNSWIISTGGGANGTGVIEIQPGASASIDHVLIDGGNNTHACIWHKGASMSVTSINCMNVNDGIFSWQDSGGTTQGNNFTIQDSYIHALTAATGNGHIDGYQTEGATNGIIRHNTIDIDKEQNAAVAVWNSYKSSDNILVDNNLLAGGGFTVYAEDYSPSEQSPAGGFSTTNIRFTNNKFSRKYFGCVGYWGIWYLRGQPTDGWNRSGNTIIETGQNVDNGNPVHAGAGDANHRPGDPCN